MNTPRFTGAPNTENTYRAFQQAFLALAYAAAVTVNPIPNAAKTLVQVANLTGAITVNIGVGTATTPPMVGDEITILLTSTAGETVTWGTGISSNAATLVVAAGKKGRATFTFDGASWVGSGFATV